MLRIHLLASGSSGNCALIEAHDGSDRVVVCLDCGIAQRTARGLAEEAGLNLCQVDAVLLSHRHSDHAANVVAVAARARAPLYANMESLNHSPRLAEVQRRKVEQRSLHDRSFFQIGPLTITPIQLPHDADPTFGFLFTTKHQKAGFFTDLGQTDVLQEAGLLEGVDTLILESNHDRAMLASGPYPQVLRQRVGGGLGHLANAQAEAFLAQAAPSSLKHLVLAHLSRKNNTEDLAFQAAKAGIQARGLAGVTIHVAPARGWLSPTANLPI